MSDKFMHSESASFELSDSDLDTVAGGTGYDPKKHVGGFAAGFSNGTATAVGSKLALTNTQNDSFAISQNGVQAAGSAGHSSSIAAS